MNCFVEVEDDCQRGEIHDQVDLRLKVFGAQERLGHDQLERGCDAAPQEDDRAEEEVDHPLLHGGLEVLLPQVPQHLRYVDPLSDDHDQRENEQDDLELPIVIASLKNVTFANVMHLIVNVRGSMLFTSRFIKELV